ncbi:hypothetical protein H6G89_00355 [Oscillatoria sp. FACHB-1407]|uniref:hypothetical protein n=1 Tax=Oscillatoria sp. FACHB-1407 TaxID=2692847 RepID=UPI0016859830|nr:hypothetical protein [Oscillatoria sp. FACHB-1407]MBD2459483.1 hypothetical protein [Oscillatoria sp. FACHB-1407]
MATTQERSSSKSKRRVTAAAVPKSMIEKASLTLADLPEKPKETLQLREAIQLLVDPITTALAKGYSREEIVTLLNDKGIDITTASLQYYLMRFRQQAPKTKGKTRRPRRKKGEIAESTVENINGSAPASEAAAPIETATTTVSEPATEPAPKKRRGPAKGSTPKTTTKRAAAKAKPAVAETVVESDKPATKTRKPRSTNTAKASEPKAKPAAKKTSTRGSTTRKPRAAKPKTT